MLPRCHQHPIKQPGATASIQRYVILQQTRAAAVFFARRGQDWLSDVVAGHQAILQLPEIDIQLPLAEVYANIVTDETPPAPSPTSRPED